MYIYIYIYMQCTSKPHTLKKQRHSEYWTLWPWASNFGPWVFLGARV